MNTKESLDIKAQFDQLSQEMKKVKAVGDATAKALDEFMANPPQAQ